MQYNPSEKGDKADAYASAEILEEYTETVEYLKNKFPGKAPKIPLIGIESKCHVIEVSSKVDICRDPDDNKFIECVKEHPFKGAAQKV